MLTIGSPAVNGCRQKVRLWIEHELFLLEQELKHPNDGFVYDHQAFFPYDIIDGLLSYTVIYIYIQIHKMYSKKPDFYRKKTW